MERSQNLLLKGLLALCILRLWIMPLPSSFWVDETGTMFVVRHGAQHPSLAIAPQVAASLYFWLPRAMDRLLAYLPNSPGVAETLYRLPSVVAMGVAVFLIGRIAVRLIHPQAAWFAVFACFALGGMDYEADNARPYALGILVVSAAALFLIRWLDQGRLRDALLFVTFAALIWRVHLLYWPFYIVLLVYAVTRLARSETPVSWRAALLVFGAVGVCLIPVLFDAIPLSRQAGAHVIAPLPPLKELIRELKFALLLVSLAIGIVLHTRRSGIHKPSLSLALAWWLIPALALFAFSWGTGNSVFVHRYLSFGLPGAVLTATALGSSLISGQRWNWAALILGTGVLVFLGDWRQVRPPHHNSDWRGAAAAINALPYGPDLPIICPSPFIEAKAPAWSPTYSLPGFLYAHLAAYPVHGKLLLFPYQGAPDANVGKRFAIYGQTPSVNALKDSYLARGGWTYKSLGNFGDVTAIVLVSLK